MGWIWFEPTMKMCGAHTVLDGNGKWKKKKCLFGNVHEEQKEKEMAIHRWDMQIHYPEGLKPAIIFDDEALRIKSNI